MKETNTFKRTDDKTTALTPIPEDAIPADEAGVMPPPKNETMVDLRLHNHRFIHDLWRTLAARTYKEINNKPYLVHITGMTPPMSDCGAMEIVNTLKFLNNPSVALGNISYEEAVVERDGLLESLAQMLVENEESYGVTSITRKKLVMSQVTPVIWNQISKAIDGHESEMIVTNINDTRGTQEVKETIHTTGSGFRMKGA